MYSNVKELGSVRFPEFTGERVYMVGFTKRDGLPSHLSRWQPTVDQMLDSVDTDGPIYFMADQGIVKGGDTHRRPGVHIDGYWHPAIQAHGEQQPYQREGHRWVPVPPKGPHFITSGRHGHSIAVGRWDTPQPQPGWKTVGMAKESILLASDVVGCRAFVGEYGGRFGDGGDCSHIDTSRMDAVTFEPGRAYAGHAMRMLHESIPVVADCRRTVVRLNVVGWE